MNNELNYDKLREMIARCEWKFAKTMGMRTELQDALSFVNDGNDFIKGSDWLYYKYVSFEEGYERLKELILIMVQHGNGI